MDGLDTTTASPTGALLGRIAREFQVMKPLLPTYGHLLISAIFPIFIASHASLARPSSAAALEKHKKPRRKRHSTSNDSESDEEEVSQKIESLTPSDAILFPVLAGGTLASLYFILKWLQDPAWLNWALGLYFSQIGLFFAMKFLKDFFIVTRSFLLPTQYSAQGQVWKADNIKKCFKNNDKQEIKSALPGLFRLMPVPGFVHNTIWKARRLFYTKAQLHLHLHKIITLKMSVTILDGFALLLSGVVVYYHTFVAKPWFLTNFLGFSFCYGSIQFMTPGTAWTGTLILSALFFYDIYFVFFTPMMVTVATKLDVPIKLLFPRPDGCIFPVGALEGSDEMERYRECLMKKRTMAMLGLGDIVIPGMIIAFALRFDLYLYYHYQKQQKRRLSQQNAVVLASAATEKPRQENDADKPQYLPAKGKWGERFWTSSRLQPVDLSAKRFPKRYFYASVIGYLIGMITTVVVMQIAAHAQPALLYLVPGVLLSLWCTALVRGEIKLLWHFTEIEEDDKDKAKKDNVSTTEKVKETEKSREKTTSEEKCHRLISFSLTLPSTKSSASDTLQLTNSTKSAETIGSPTTQPTTQSREASQPESRAMDQASKEAGTKDWESELESESDDSDYATSSYSADTVSRVDRSAVVRYETPVQSPSTKKYYFRDSTISRSAEKGSTGIDLADSEPVPKRRRKA